MVDKLLKMGSKTLRNLNETDDDCDHNTTGSDFKNSEISQCQYQSQGLNLNAEYCTSQPIMPSQATQLKYINMPSNEQLYERAVWANYFYLESIDQINPNKMMQL